MGQTTANYDGILCWLHHIHVSCDRNAFLILSVLISMICFDDVDLASDERFNCDAIMHMSQLMKPLMYECMIS